MTVQPIMKNYIDKFTLQLGDSIVTIGSLVGIRKPVTKTAKQSAKFNLVTPDGGSVSQMFIDKDGNLWDKDDLSYQKAPASKTDIVSDKVVSQEVVKKAKTSVLTKSLLDLSVHPRAQFESMTFRSDSNAYVFIPHTDDPMKRAKAQLLNVMADDEDYILVGKCNLKNYENLYVLSKWRNHLVIERYLYADEINPHETLALNVSESSRNKVRKMLENACVELNTDTYKDDINEAMVDVEAAANSKQVPEIDIEDFINNL